MEAEKNEDAVFASGRVSARPVSGLPWRGPHARGRRDRDHRVDPDCYPACPMRFAVRYDRKESDSI